MKTTQLICSIVLIAILLILPGYSCTNGSGTNLPDSTIQQIFQVDELQADFKQFREFLEGSHPQLYRFTSRHEFDSLFEAQYLMIDHPMTTQEFYPVLIPLVAKVGCGHTSFWSPDGYWDRAPQKMFPLGVYAKEGQLYVIHSYNLQSEVEYGSRIISVNGQNADEIVTEMLGNIWSDGFIKTKRYRRLNNVFPYQYALLYGYPEHIEIVSEFKGMETKTIVEPVSRQVLTDYHNSKVSSGEIPTKDLTMDMVNDHIAVMRIRTFAYYNDVQGFHRFIDSSFQVIRDHNIGNVIIDMRGNQGGDPWCSSHLLGYLQKEPVIYFRNSYGSYARLNKPIPMAEHPFEGNQYYLIDGMCFSTTGHLTSLLKYHGLGIFVGEETGATFTCNDASHDIYLKHTGYRLQSARKTFATAVSGLPMNQGILPDHEVTPTIEDVINKRDAVWEYTLEFIGKVP